MNKQNANFMVPRLGNGDENEGSGGGYRADDVNYRCQGQERVQAVELVDATPERESAV